MSKVRESNWYGLNICTECERRLSFSQVMDSSGICPRCGHNNRSTVCATRMVVLKEFKHHPWWRFWDRKYTYKGKDEFSETWANGKRVK